MTDFNRVDEKDKQSPLSRLFSAFGSGSKTKPAGASGGEDLGDKPWEKAKTSDEMKPKPAPTPAASPKPASGASDNDADDLAGSLAKRNKTISDKVGGWSKK